MMSSRDGNHHRGLRMRSAGNASAVADAVTTQLVQELGSGDDITDNIYNGRKSFN